MLIISNTLRYFSLRYVSYMTNLYTHHIKHTHVLFTPMRLILNEHIHISCQPPLGTFHSDMPYTSHTHSNYISKPPLVLFTATRLILPIPTLQFKHAGVPFPHCCVTSRSLRAASCLSRSHPNHPLTIAATPGRSGIFRHKFDQLRVVLFLTTSWPAYPLARLGGNTY